MVGEVGLEPTKAKPADLQSAPFAARDTPPFPRRCAADENAPGDPEARSVVYLAPGADLSTGKLHAGSYARRKALGSLDVSRPHGRLGRPFCDFDRAALNLRVAPRLGRAATIGVVR